MVALAKFPMAVAEFEVVRTADVEASPLNYRKTFSNVGELGEDIKANGLRVPIKVRSNPRKTTKWELVYGERRWRGAQAAGVDNLPALIQELSDEEVGMGCSGNDPLGKETKETCKLFKVDWEELASDAAEEIKLAVEDQKAKSKPKKKGGK